MRCLRALLDAPSQTEAQEGLRPYRAAFRALPTLETPRLLIRPPRMSDAQDMFAYAHDGECSRYVLWDKHERLSDSRSSLRGLITRNRQGYPGTFAIQMKSDRRMIGTIGFQWIDADNLSCELGYSIARRLWGHGLAGEALGALLRYAFVDLRLERVEARHDVLNPASGRVLEKAGFLEEGIARQCLLLKGRRADVRRWAILRSAWQAREQEIAKGAIP